MTDEPVTQGVVDDDWGAALGEQAPGGQTALLQKNQAATVFQELSDLLL